jgi:hypothetical protein
MVAGFPTAPVPTSFGPCCENCASVSCDEKSSAAKIRTDAPNDLDDFKREIGQARPVIGASAKALVFWVGLKGRQ